MKFSSLLRPLAAASLALLTACGSTRTSSGHARITVNVPSRFASAAAVTRVVVGVSGPGISSQLLTPATKDSGGLWSVTIPSIPVTPVNQTDTFQVWAYDAANANTFYGTAQSPILAGRDAVISITLQATDATANSANSAPFIYALTSAASTVDSLQQVVLTAAAVDPNGNPIRITWSAKRGATAVGSFSQTSLDVTNGAIFSTIYTAPADSGPVTITATVAQTTTNPALSTSESFILDVNATTGGNTTVNISFNNSPYITSISYLPLRPQPGDTVNLTATALDPDTGDTIQINWNSSCPNGLTGADPTGTVTNSPTAHYTVPALAFWTSTYGGQPIQCQFYATALDFDNAATPKARGGSGVAAVTLQIGPSLPPGYAPVVDSAFQDTQQAYFGENLNLYVHAHLVAPQPGSPNVITYAWGTNDGAVTVPDFANHAVWAPTRQCQHNAQAWVDVTDANTGHSTHQVFNLNTCAPKGCAAYFLAGASNGPQYVDPDGDGPQTPFSVYCDMTLPGGGWGVVGNLGYAHRLVPTDSMLSRTPQVNNFSQWLQPGFNGNGTGTFEHYDLREFNAYGNDYTILVETGDFSAPDASQAGAELSFYRPKTSCTAGQCSPGVAGANWLGSGTDTLFQLANYPSQYSSIPLTWMDLPGFTFGVGAAPTLALFGYNVLSPAGCTATNCPCVDGTTGTKTCYHPAGGILSGRTGALSASTSLDDYFLGFTDGVTPVGGGGADWNSAVIYIHEGRLNTFTRFPYPAAPTPPSGTAGPPIIDAFTQDRIQSLNGENVNLHVAAHLALPVAGKSNVLSYLWGTNDGAVTPQQAGPGNATWAPAVGCMVGSKAWVDVVDNNTGSTVRQEFLLETCAPASCADILALHPETAQHDGSYFIDPDGPTGPVAPFPVWCDMTRLGGGWQLVANVGSQHLFTDTEDLLTDTIGGVINPTLDNYYGPAGFVHQDLTRFDAYGANYTVMAEVIDGLAPTSGHQLSFYRPKTSPACTPTTCSTEVLGGNWLTGGADTKFQIANYPSEFPAIPLTWVDTPGFNYSGVPTPPAHVMLGYNQPSCDLTGCPCVDPGLGTQICHSPAGVLASGNTGVSSANSSLDDVFISITDGTQTVGGVGGTRNPALIWLYDGRLNTFPRAAFPQAGNPGSGVDGQQPVIDSFVTSSPAAVLGGITITVQAHATATPAGLTNQLRYSWSANGGTITPAAGAPNVATWMIDSNCVPDSKAQVVITDVNTGATSNRFFNIDTCARGCAAILAQATVQSPRPSGVYEIDPDGTGPIPSMNVFCDMSTAFGGGWAAVGAVPFSAAITSASTLTTRTSTLADRAATLNPSSFYNYGSFEHYDLSEFNALGQDFTLLIRTAEYNQGTPHGEQIALYRPRDGATITPGQAGTNWKAGNVAAQFQITNYNSRSASSEPINWINVPAFNPLGPAFALFGYSTASPPGCTGGNCPCVDQTVGTLQCFNPPGVLVSGFSGAFSANSTMNDGFNSYGAGIGGGGGQQNPVLIFIHDGRLDTFNRTNF